MAEVRRQEFVCSLSELAANPSKVLAENEFLYVRQADGKLKMMCGDGVTAISALPYTIDIGAIEQAVIDAQEGAETAAASLDKLTNLTASVETLPPDSDATVAKTTMPDGYALAFGIPRGDKGDTGAKGDKGDPGEVTQAELDAVTSQLAESADQISANTTAMQKMDYSMGESFNTSGSSIDIVEPISLSIGVYSTPKSTSITANTHYASVRNITFNINDLLGFVDASMLNIYKFVFAQQTESAFGSYNTANIEIITDGIYSIRVAKVNGAEITETELTELNVKFGKILNKDITKYTVGYDSLTNDVKDRFEALKLSKYNIVNVMDYGAVADGVTNDSGAFQACLDLALTYGSITVCVQDGNYKIGTILNYYPNTRIIMHENTVLLRTGNLGKYLTNNSIAGDGVKPYSLGYLEIFGGTFKGDYSATTEGQILRCVGIQCGKLSRLKIVGTKFIDACAGNHLIDMSGCANIHLQYNTFAGMRLPSAERPTEPETASSYNLEMLQIDIAQGLGVGTTDEWRSYPSYNVTIQDNIFCKGTDEDSIAYRAIGVHSNPLENLYFDNVCIKNNRFYDTLDRVIGISSWKNAEICGNRFEVSCVMSDAIIKITQKVGIDHDINGLNIHDNEAIYMVEDSGPQYGFLSVNPNGSLKKVYNLRVVGNTAPDFKVSLINTSHAVIFRNELSAVEYDESCDKILDLTSEAFERLIDSVQA